jgi:manganese/zinc/iron transport system substrate-binding protein
MPRRARAVIAGVAALLALLPVVSGCGETASAPAAEIGDRKVRVAATTNFITDLAKVIGGPRAEVTGLMGPGVDPHLYKASAGDVQTLADADMVLYGGLELEGKMEELLEEAGRERATVPVTRAIPGRRLIPLEGTEEFDPHVWFDVTLWEDAARTVADAYVKLDPEHERGYRRRADAYLEELRRLDRYVEDRAQEVSARSRVLVTSHDAFAYLGRRYGFRVMPIQGTSTQTEATTADIERVAAVMAERDVRSVFAESSVPRQTIDAVLAAARRRGHDASVGGELFSDAAGPKGTSEGTYLGMVRHNIDTIVDGLR